MDWCTGLGWWTHLVAGCGWVRNTLWTQIPIMCGTILGHLGGNMQLSENTKNSRLAIVVEWAGVQARDGGHTWWKGAGVCGTHCGHASPSCAERFRVIWGGNMQFNKNSQNRISTIVAEWTGVQAWDGGHTWW